MSDYFVIVFRPVRDFAVTWLREQLHDEQMIAPVSGVDRLEILEAAHEQCCSEQEHQRKSDLRGNQRAAQAPSATADCARAQGQSF